MTLLIGVLTNEAATTATASALLPKGETEKEIACVVAATSFQALALLLADTRKTAIRIVQIYTNDKALLQFLTPPIRVKPTMTTKVTPLFRPRFPLIEVPSGGDPWQWSILYQLLYFKRWQIKLATKLPNTEVIYAEYLKSTTRPSLSGGARRLDVGLWTAA